MEKQPLLQDEVSEKTEKNASSEQQAKDQEAPKQKRAEDSVRSQVLDIAIQIGEDPASIQVKRDGAYILKRMQEGLIIGLRIRRPRCTDAITLTDFGLATKDESALSEAAENVISNYFQLGQRSLLPQDMRKRLAKAEANARYILKKMSFKTQWGQFVPLTRYAAWKEKNEQFEREFWALRDEIIASYDDLIEQVVSDHRPLAEDAWRRLSFGSATRDDTSADVMQNILARLASVENKEAFIKLYLEYVRAAMPDLYEIETGFSYEVTKTFIPLPSLVASDLEQADRIYRQRALEDAETQARLDAIEIARRNEQRNLSLAQQLEENRLYEQLNAERRRQEQQRQMEQDVLNEARDQKEKLVASFYSGVIHQINEMVKEVSENIVESIEKNHGRLLGPVGTQLENLISELRAMNFMGDQTIESYIERLQKVLPKEQQAQVARGELARIDTSHIVRVVSAIHKETERLQVNLEAAPRQRKARQEGALNLDGAAEGDHQRETRPGLNLAAPQEVTRRRFAGRRAF